MVSYFELPIYKKGQFSWKLGLKVGIVFFIALILFFSSFIQQAFAGNPVFQDLSTYTKTLPNNAGDYVTVFSGSFVPTKTSSHLQFVYDYMASANYLNVSILVRINNVTVFQGNKSLPSGGFWTTFTEGYVPYNLNAGTTYNIQMLVGKGSQYNGTYSVSIRNFSAYNSAPWGITAQSTNSSVTLFWSQSAPADGFRIFRNGVQIAQVNSTTRHYTNTGLPSNTSYTWFVRAYLNSGVYSDSYDITKGTTSGDVIPPVLQIRNPEPGTYYQNPPLNIAVTYTDSDSGVLYTRHCVSIGNCDPGTTPASTFTNGTAIDSGIYDDTPGTLGWFLCTRASDNAGNWSSIDCANYSRQLVKPQIYNVSASGSSVTLQWYDYSTETHQIQIYRSHNGGPFTYVTDNVNSGSTSYTRVLNNEPCGTNVYQIWNIQQSANSVSAVSNPVQVCDAIAPTVTSLNALTPTRVAPVINFSATDSGGSGIAYYQVWRTSEANYPNGWTNVSGNIGVTSWTDSNVNRGIWWYRLRVVDGAGNCINNLGSHCGGAQTDSLDPRTAVPDVRVVLDNIAPVILEISPNPGTYACSTSNPTYVNVYASDSDWPQSPPVTIHYTTTTGAVGGGKTGDKGNFDNSLAQTSLPGNNLGRVLQASTPTCASPQKPSGGVPVTQDNTTVNFVACDQAGNQSSVVSGVYRCNTSPPNISFTASTPPLNSWTNGNISVTAQAYDADRVSNLRQCWTNTADNCTPLTSFGNCNGTTTTCSGTAIYNASQGQIRICVQATDVPGNTSTVQCSGPYGRDTTNPNNPSIIPANPNINNPYLTNNKTPSINVGGTDNSGGSGVAGFTVDFYDHLGGSTWQYCTSQTISGFSGTLTMPIACYNGTYGGVGGEEFGIFKKFKQPLAWLKNIFLPKAQAQGQVGGEGLYRFQIRSRDLAGNYSNIVYHYVEIDTTPPSTPTFNNFGYHWAGVNYINQNIMNNHQEQIIITGTCSGASSYIMYLNNFLVATGQPCNNGAWSYSIYPSDLADHVPADGEFFWQIFTYDAANNYSTSYAMGVKDTTPPTVPSGVICTSYINNYPAIPVNWRNSTDLAGIRYYQVQNYTCASSSTPGGACQSPTLLTTSGGIYSPNYSYTPSGDRYYAWAVRAMDNALNFSAYSPLSPACLSDRTSPNSTNIVPCGQGSQTTCSPTNNTTPTIQFTPGTDPLVNGVASGSSCVTVSTFQPGGAECGGFGVCLDPNTNTYTLPSSCYYNQLGKKDEPAGFFVSLWRRVVNFVKADQPAPTGGDGTYFFRLQTQDAASNISRFSYHPVEIDTVGPMVGNDLQINVDPRPNLLPNQSRNYTASSEDMSTWQTNSNWPKFTIGCTSDCQFKEENPMNTLINWHPERGDLVSISCAEIAGQFPNMYCSTECSAPDSYAACFNVHFDPNFGKGHNGTLIVPLANVFRDTAGNPAQGTAQLTIENQAPAIIVK